MLLVDVSRQLKPNPLRFFREEAIRNTIGNTFWISIRFLVCCLWLLSPIAKPNPHDPRVCFFAEVEVGTTNSRRGYSRTVDVSLGLFGFTGSVSNRFPKPSTHLFYFIFFFSCSSVGLDLMI